jgi:hypothetical protein
MTTRAAARPLRRHLKARVRAAALPASYTISGDTTPAVSLGQVRALLAGRTYSSINPMARPGIG